MPSPRLPAALALATAVALLPPVASEATSCAVWSQRFATSPDGTVLARSEQDWDPPRAISHWVEYPDGSRQSFELSGGECLPDQLVVFDDGSLVTVGESCERGLDALITLSAYHPDGSRRWTIGREALLPAGGQGLVHRGDCTISWTSDVRAEGDPRRRDAAVVVVLRDGNEVRVDLDDGAVRHVPRTLADDWSDAQALLARARYRETVGDEEGSLALLRRAQKVAPDDEHATTALAERLHGAGRPEEAVALWRAYVARHPYAPASGDRRSWVDPRESLLWSLQRAGDLDGAVKEVLAMLRDAEAPGPWDGDASEARLHARGVNDTRLQALELLLRTGEHSRADALVEPILRQAAVEARETCEGEACEAAGPWSPARGYLFTVERIAAAYREVGRSEDAERLLADGRRRSRDLLAEGPPPDDPRAVVERGEALLDMGDVAGAIAHWTAAAPGNAAAALKLGELYTEDERVPRNLPGALRAYEAAEARADALRPLERENVQVALCTLHRRARSEPDLPAAAASCTRAAEAGRGTGLFWLAIHRAAGAGVERDAARAAELLGRARDAHVPGYGHDRSPETVRDHRWAASVLTPLAEGGSLIAQATLATLHRLHHLGEHGDREAGERWLARAAKAGDGPSMRSHARCDRPGWYRRAAEAGESEAHLELARCHLDGRIAPPDLAAAEAALRAYVEAQTRAGETPWGADRAYGDLERLLGRPVERPLLVHTR